MARTAMCSGEGGILPEEKAAAYKYPHVYPNHYVKQRYLPESLGDRTYYEYGPNKTEQAAKRYWDDIKGT